MRIGTCMNLMAILFVFSTQVLGFGEPRPVRAQGKPIKEKEFTDFISQVEKSRTAESALTSLNGFAMANELNAKQAERIEKIIVRFKQYQQSHLRQHGGKWRTPSHRWLLRSP